MDLKVDDLLSLHRWMVEGRMFEAAIAKIKGNYHPAEGEEGVIVGSFYGLKDEDVVAPHFRGSIIVSYMRGGRPGKALRRNSGESHQLQPWAVAG